MFCLDAAWVCSLDILYWYLYLGASLITYWSDGHCACSSTYVQTRYGGHSHAVPIIYLRTLMETCPRFLSLWWDEQSYISRCTRKTPLREDLKLCQVPLEFITGRMLSRVQSGCTEHFCHWKQKREFYEERENIFNIWLDILFIKWILGILTDCKWIYTV